MIFIFAVPPFQKDYLVTRSFFAYPQLTQPAKPANRLTGLTGTTGSTGQTDLQRATEAYGLGAEAAADGVEGCHQVVISLTHGGVFDEKV